MFKALKRTFEPVVEVEERRVVSVRWDTYLHMFIIRDIQKDMNLDPCFSVVDLLDTIREKKYKVSDPKKTRESMNQAFTPKDQTFFHLNYANGIDFARMVSYS